MKKKTVKPDRICFECLHYEACQSWNIGSLVKTAADNCVNYRASVDVRPVVFCKDCRHRDPEDHKCDSGESERQGCPFKVADDYFCAYGEK